MECRDDPGSATGVLVCTMVSCFVLMSYCMCTGKGLCGQGGFSKGLIIKLGLGHCLPAGPVLVINYEYCYCLLLPTHITPNINLSDVLVQTHAVMK